MFLEKKVIEDRMKLIDILKYKTETGKMKKYLIQCPCCKRLENSVKPLNDLGILVLYENEYIYQRCSRCQGKEIDEHEKETILSYKNID